MTEHNLPEEQERIPGQGTGPVKPRILIVEDNAINAMVLSIFLEDHFITAHALNGADALKMTSDTEYDLILMDINLGRGMNGIQATNEIRKSEIYRDKPIIAVTGYHAVHDREYILKHADFHGFIPKPIDEQELIDTVNEVLKDPVAALLSMTPDESKKHSPRR